ncbi:zinc finger protein 2 homolog isoform X4 [Cryptotermes secundus]|uniref:zinc finger protein 2 homolog isoform X4 n=1 Tax=Cryptotermes secundus TaxID=105785 RepID=UPI001454D01C|nr:zinc finger protein 2 homolog isoform X4 [Cryptotermes secundus]
MQTHTTREIIPNMDVIKVEPGFDSETSVASLLPYGQHIGVNLAAENVLVALPTLKKEVKTEARDVAAVKEESLSEVTVEEHEVCLGSMEHTVEEDDYMDRGTEFDVCLENKNKKISDGGSYIEKNVYTLIHVATSNRRKKVNVKHFKCEVCNSLFSKRKLLIRHFRTHTGEKPFRCKVCNKGFPQSGDLTRHVRIHSGEKPFQCDVCNKGFSQSGNLATHIRTHTEEEKGYRCIVCNVVFIQNGQLARHMTSHTGEDPYKCDICSKVFTRFKYLTIHRQTHSEEKLFCCGGGGIRLFNLEDGGVRFL